jgi:peptidoglycan/LPS O-acetylase OafA/YrhL
MTAKLPQLTALRFLAASVVVAYHASSASGPVPIWPPGWLKWSLPGQAVSIFFVLSGFVLQRGHGGRRGAWRHAAWVFVAHRLARIWPAMAVVVTAAVLLLPVASQYGNLVVILGLASAWSSDPMSFFWPADVPIWSLSTEMAFYLAFPLVTARVASRPAAAGAAILWLMLLTAVWQPVDQTARFAAFYINPIARIPEFVLGMAAAEVLPLATRWGGATMLWTLAEIIAFGAVIGLNLWIAAHLELIASWSGPNFAEWARGAGCAPAAAVLVVTLAVGRGLVSRSLCWRPLVWLGEVSFAIYLVHWPLLSLDFRAEAAAVYPASVLVVAWLLYLAVERPAMATAKRMLRYPRVRSLSG